MSRAASASPVTSAMLCIVPPDIPSENARHPARHPGHGDLEVDLGELLAVALARRLGGEPHREVGWQRLEPAGLDDLHAGGLGGGAVAVEHPARERDLAGQVDVVGAAVDAGGDHRLAVEGVRADEVDDDASPAPPSRAARRVADVGGDRHRRLDALLAEHPLELLRGREPRPPSGHRAAATRSAEVGGDPPAGDAGRAEDDDVDLAARPSRRPYPAARRVAARRSSTAGSRAAPPRSRACRRATSRGSESRPGTKLWWILVADRVGERDRRRGEQRAAPERRGERPAPQRGEQEVLAEVRDRAGPGGQTRDRPPPAPRDRRSRPSAPAARGRGRASARPCAHGTLWTSNRFVPRPCCGRPAVIPIRSPEPATPRLAGEPGALVEQRRQPRPLVGDRALDAEQEVEPAHGLDPRRDREDRHPRPVRGDEARRPPAAGRDDDRLQADRVGRRRPPRGRPCSRRRRGRCGRG